MCMEFIKDKGAFYRYLYEECHCVNAYQTPEQRRMKYTLARGLGADSSWAMVLRDRRPNNFAKHFGFKRWADLIRDCEARVNSRPHRINNQGRWLKCHG